jgi:endonuclease YncB( thermonuclease family)
MLAALLLGGLAACTLDSADFAPEVRPTRTPATSSGITPDGEACDVTRVIDGDTIDVRCGGVGYRVRYIGINTPESDEPCYLDAKNANAALVEDRQVTLVRDRSNTDRFGRLLRYIYVGETFVEAELVRDGFAEVVLYEPDDLHYDELLALEIQAAEQNIGCHPTGIFDDGSYVR